MRPYEAWLRRHMTICNVLTVVCMIAAAACVVIGARGLYAGQSALVLAGAIGAMVLAYASERFHRDADQLWRALAAWERGENEIKHLPRRLLREIDG